MNNKKIIFSVFADLHYKYMMYSPSLEDLDKIFKRADENNVDFVIHCGDFCNDYIGSPELYNSYLNNEYGIEVHGIYGNHELESSNNSMSFVTPKLTNGKENIWGTYDGKIGDGNIAYYFFDKNGFRIICTDTNYSYNSDISDWEHNRTCSYGAPAENSAANSLGEHQLKWLERVLLDAAQKGLKCIIFSHASFSNIWSSSPDTDKIKEMFSKANGIRKGTVLMAINGHYHTNHLAMKDEIVYMDVNTVKNGAWIPKGYQHYGPEHIFKATEYDSDGNEIIVTEKSLDELSMGKNTWFFEEPLSAIITVEENGHIIIDGAKTHWVYNIPPEADGIGGCETQISSKEFNLPV